ncbi:MAG: hypothetical protein GY811_00845 [Myxococcales bacterium]|nr:hypothetical protein [Myxococcales bacterium]
MSYKARSKTVEDKRFMFLSFGFEKPTPEIVGAWGKWFKSIADRMLEQGGFWAGGRELSENGSKNLPFGKDSITGFVIFTADSLDEAVDIAGECPFVASNHIYEIMSQ